MEKKTALTLAEIDGLERKARAATPGPWRSGRMDMRSYNAATGEQFKNIYGPNYEPELHHGERIAIEVAKAVGDAALEDAAFIGAANPTTALALLAVARSHLQLVSALETLARRKIELYEQAGRTPRYVAFQVEEPGEPVEYKVGAENVVDCYVRMAEKLGWKPESEAE